MSGDGTAWTDATLAAALFACDPAGMGGVVVRAHAGSVRDKWLAYLRAMMPATKLRRIPLNVADGRLLGGLDLAATLRAGRPMAERGILAEADGGLVVLAMAERLASLTASRLTAAIDTGEVVLARDGVTLRSPARFGVIALDEGMADDERPPPALLDRMAFHIDLAGIADREAAAVAVDPAEIVAARALAADVAASDAIIEALSAAAMALGIASIRAVLLALRAARMAAALAGRRNVLADDAAVAGRLVLGPRAVMLPAAEAPAETDPAEPSPEERVDPAPGGAAGDDQGAEDDTPDNERPLDDVVLSAARAAIPGDLLAQLKLAEKGVPRSRSVGRAGALQNSNRRGRPAGLRRGELRAGARLNVAETLRAAAPWQRLRRPAAADVAPVPRLVVRQEDFRVTRYKQRAETTTIFVVDASGSSALHRLAEAKGAVELLLADCYVRRDKVAVLAFRGRGAELLLPPTRSLVRAKRSLAGLPGGGGTPLAAGIDAAGALADLVRRKGATPVIILLTDGRANVGRDGAGDRAQAEAEALAAARSIRVSGLTALLVDTSPRPHAAARRLAEAMSALYLPLPHADAALLSRAVRATASTPGRDGREA